MIHVKKDEMSLVAPLFRGIEDSMVIACLQGYQGDAYTDDLANPTVALIVSGEYSFFGGAPDTAEAAEMARAVLDYTEGAHTIAIFADENPGWEQTLLSIPANHPRSVPRFGIAQRDYDFDIPMLRGLAAGLPEGCHIVPFGETLYDQAMAADWSKEFCETFTSAADYLSKGFGFAAVRDGALLSGASTMTVYDGGAEIQVATRSDCGGQGLATACAAAFIIECANRGIRPCWDAANETSLHMALKLGYEYKGEYTTVHMHR